MVNAVERIMGRRQINQIINNEGILISLERKPKLSTAGGGWKWGTGFTLPPQQVALIPFKRRMTQFLINTELGNLPDLPYVLLGRWNLNIEKDDTFTWQGDEFTVATIDFKTEIRVAAQVDYSG